MLQSNALILCTDRSRHGTRSFWIFARSAALAKAPFQRLRSEIRTLKWILLLAFAMLSPFSRHVAAPVQLLAAHPETHRHGFKSPASRGGALGGLSSQLSRNALPLSLKGANDFTQQRHSPEDIGKICFQAVLSPHGWFRRSWHCDHKQEFHLPKPASSN